MTDEHGYTPEELERGEDRPGCTVTMHPLGCMVLLALLTFAAITGARALLG